MNLSNNDEKRKKSIKCEKCGAENENAKFCAYCGAKLENGEILAMQVYKTFVLTGRGFMVNGISKIELKANDVVKNSRTKKAFVIWYVANKEYKVCKKTNVNEEHILCLMGATHDDFVVGDDLIV